MEEREGWIDSWASSSATEVAQRLLRRGLVYQTGDILEGDASHPVDDEGFDEG